MIYLKGVRAVHGVYQVLFAVWEWQEPFQDCILFLLEPKTDSGRPACEQCHLYDISGPTEIERTSTMDGKSQLANLVAETSRTASFLRAKQ